MKEVHLSERGILVTKRNIAFDHTTVHIGDVAYAKYTAEDNIELLFSSFFISIILVILNADATPITHILIIAMFIVNVVYVALQYNSKSVIIITHVGKEHLVLRTKDTAFADKVFTAIQNSIINSIEYKIANS